MIVKTDGSSILGLQIVQTRNLDKDKTFFVTS